MISPISAGGGFTRTGICTIVDMDSLEIEVDVNEAFIRRVEPGQRVTATLDAYPNWQIPAEVIAIVPTADRQKATVKVRIGFLERDERILRDMGVRVTFHASEAPDEAPEELRGVTISEAALQSDAEGDFVGGSRTASSRDGRCTWPGRTARARSSPGGARRTSASFSSSTTSCRY